MSAPRAVAPESLALRVRWTLNDYVVIAGQEFLHLAKMPSIFVWRLVNPVVMVLLFVYVFGSNMDVTGEGLGIGYVDYAMPGFFAINMFTGFVNTAWVIADTKERGIIDRVRCMPIASSAVVVGRNIVDTVRAATELLVLVGIALLVGWRPAGSVAETLAALGLLLLLRFAMTWVGIWLGLVVKGVEQTGMVAVLAFPAGMISSVFALPSSMPGWLQTVAVWNPVSATATAIRDLFHNPMPVGDAWPEAHALLAAVVWPVALTAVCMPFAVRRFNRLAT